MELPFAGLHQLCAPMLDRLDALPEPQRRRSAGVRAVDGTPPDRFLWRSPCSACLADVAGEQPLLCLVDDAQWLDGASAQVLGFVARRVLAEPVAIVFAVREPSRERGLAGLPELALAGLAEEDARTVLATVVPGRLDDRVRDRIVAETRGNPLALLELPRGMTRGGARGRLRAARPRSRSPGGSRSASGRLDRLPRGAPAAARRGRGAGRRPAAACGAPPSGSGSASGRRPRAEAGPDRDRRAGEVPPPARALGRLPAAAPEERRAVHLALAEVTDPEVDADRRAWHLASAAAGPDEEIALELEHSAGRAQARGGLAAAAAFLQRSVALTPRSDAAGGPRARRRGANLHAGAFDPAVGLLAAAEAGPLDEMQRARVDLLRGQIAFASSVGNDAPPLLLTAARRLEPLDGALARETYLDAWGAALFAGRLAAAEAWSRCRARPAPAHRRPTRRVPPTSCSPASPRS